MTDTEIQEKLKTILKENAEDVDDLEDGTFKTFRPEYLINDLVALINQSNREYGNWLIGSNENVDTQGRIYCNCDCTGAFCNSLVHQCKKPKEHYPQNYQAVVDIHNELRSELRKKNRE